MDFKFENTTINNCQFGKNNSMNVQHNILSELEQYWLELGRVLDEQLRLGKLSQSEYNIIKDANKYVKNEDKKGFVNFLRENKKDLFINILSGVISSGLQAALMGI